MSKQHPDKSLSSHAILDKESRKIKALKIIAVLKKNTGNLKNKRILDIGTGAGHIASFLGSESNSVVSIDVVDERRQKGSYKFIKVQDENLPFKDNTFDIVISNHVIEHVPNQQRHVDEIFRVLKNGGIVYLATPNKYWLTDPHYRLYFISWMPNGLAKRYLTIMKGKGWDIKPLSLRGIKKLTKGKSSNNLIFIDMIKEPQTYHMDNYAHLQNIIKKTPRGILKTFGFFIPTIVILLKKQ